MNEWYSYVIVAIAQASYSFAFLAIYLYMKEIPLFLQRGYPIAFLVFFRLLGNVCYELFKRACTIYDIPLRDSHEWPLRVFAVIVGTGPACLQILFLTFKYRYEPLQFLVSINQEDVALQAVPEMYSDPNIGVQHVQELIAKHDREKHLSIKSWSHLLTSNHCLDVCVCGIFFFLCYHVGYIPYALPLHYLTSTNSSFYLIMANSFYLLWIPLLIFSLNWLRIWQLLATGFGLSALFHGLALWCMYLGLNKSSFFLISTMFASLPYYACLLVPYAQYILRALSDKGVCLCLCAHFMGSLTLILDCTSTTNLTVYSLLLCGMVETLLGLIIIFVHIRPNEKNLT